MSMMQYGTNLQFQKSADEALRLNKNHSHIMIVFDIDDFHDINQICGQSVGNEILKHIEDTLKSTISLPNLYCRLFDDNFAIFLEGYKDIDVALLVIQLSEDISGYYTDLKIKLSFGTSKADPSDTYVSSLCSRAYFAKSTIKGKGRHWLGSFNEIIQNGQPKNLAVL